MEKGLDFHKELLIALKVGDSKKAKKIMYEHIVLLKINVKTRSNGFTN